ETVVEALARHLRDARAPFGLAAVVEVLQHPLKLDVLAAVRARKRLERAPEGTYLAPKRRDVAPERLHRSPERIDVAVERIEVAPEGRDVAVERIQIAQERADVAPEGLDAAKERVDVAVEGIDRAEGGRDRPAKRHKPVGRRCPRILTGKEIERIWRR